MSEISAYKIPEVEITFITFDGEFPSVHAWLYSLQDCGSSFACSYCYVHEQEIHIALYMYVKSKEALFKLTLLC